MDCEARRWLEALAKAMCRCHRSGDWRTSLPMSHAHTSSIAAAATAVTTATAIAATMTTAFLCCHRVYMLVHVSRSLEGGDCRPSRRTRHKSRSQSALESLCRHLRLASLQRRFQRLTLFLSRVYAYHRDRLVYTADVCANLMFVPCSTCTPRLSVTVMRHPPLVCESRRTRHFRFWRIFPFVFCTHMLPPTTFD